VNVKCIVESCGTDPRVQTVPVARVQTDSAVAIAAAFSRTRFAKNAKPIAVLSNSDDVLSCGVAATYAAAVGGPLLLTAGGALDAQVIAEVQRLGSTDIRVVGLGLSSSIDNGLSPYGRTVTRPFASTNHADLSSEVAVFVQSKTKSTRAICVESEGASFGMAPIAAAAAASKGMLFLVGVANAAQHAKNGVILTYMVGEEAAAHANEVAGSKAIHAGGAIGMAAELATYMTTVEHTNVANITLAPRDGNAGLSASPGVVILHSRPGSLDGARDWMFAARPGFRQVFAVGATGGLNNDGYYEAQSLVNGFEAHLLIGVSGEGLPVISQPESERPIGLARLTPVDNAPTAQAAYWTNRG
jgi:hypothetical protein